MHFSLLNIKNGFFPLWGVAFIVRLFVDKIISVPALLISLNYLTLQIVKNSFFNIRKSVSANSNLQPKALDFKGFSFIVVCNRLNCC